MDDVWNVICGMKRGKSDANGRLSSDHFIFACKICLFIWHWCFLRYLYMVMYHLMYWCVYILQCLCCVVREYNLVFL